MIISVIILIRVPLLLLPQVLPLMVVISVIPVVYVVLVVLTRLLILLSAEVLIIFVVHTVPTLLSTSMVRRVLTIRILLAMFMIHV